MKSREELMADIEDVLLWLDDFWECDQEDQEREIGEAYKLLRLFADKLEWEAEDEQKH